MACTLFGVVLLVIFEKTENCTTENLSVSLLTTLAKIYPSSTPTELVNKTYCSVSRKMYKDIDRKNRHKYAKVGFTQRLSTQFCRQCQLSGNTTKSQTQRYASATFATHLHRKLEK
jgi:hypothetical protein